MATVELAKMCCLDFVVFLSNAQHDRGIHLLGHPLLGLLMGSCLEFLTLTNNHAYYRTMDFKLFGLVTVPLSSPHCLCRQLNLTSHHVLP